MQKRFRSSAVPKGVKLGAEYTDRATARELEYGRDERELRVLALEEQMKLGQIDREIFEKLRDQITGGDLRATHLVKGLDRQLLERVRKGEDVLSEEFKSKALKVSASPKPDAETELENFENKEIVPVHREETRKRGVVAPPPPLSLAGKKRTRNDILAEWKASRKAEEEAKAAAQLGPRFKKVGTRLTHPTIERDESGREVLITVDENGRTKRKVRRNTRVTDSDSVTRSVLDKSSKALGMAVPEHDSNKAPLAGGLDIDDGDIFEGVGHEYDPLAAVEKPEDASSDEEQASDLAASDSSRVLTAGAINNDGATSILGVEASPIRTDRHDYFKVGYQTAANPDNKPTNVNDPTILNAIRRAAAMQLKHDSLNGQNDQATERHSSAAHRLLQRDRDLDDIDMEFGSSRFEDDEDESEAKRRVKISQWDNRSKGCVADGEVDTSKHGAGERRRKEVQTKPHGRR